MIERILADGVAVLHFAYIAFVAAGALLLFRWPRLAWIHVPAVVWAVIVLGAGLICPLTPLENSLRESSGEAGYGPSFIDHYIVPVIYPSGNTRLIQIGLAIAALVANAAIYTIVVRRVVIRRRRARSDPRSASDPEPRADPRSRSGL